MNKLTTQSFLKIFLGLFTSIIIVGCASNDTSQDITDDFSDLQILSKKSNDLKKNSQTSIETTPPSGSFSSLKTAKKLQSEGTYGKTDPFSKYSDSSSNILSNSLRLKGIIATDKVKYALVEYKSMPGHIEQGQIGGKTTQLLPMGVKVKKIDEKNQSVLLTLKGKTYQLSF